MAVLAAKGHEEARQRRHEGLAFARGHFRDFAFVENDAPDELHVEGPRAIRGTILGHRAAQRVVEGHRDVHEAPVVLVDALHPHVQVQFLRRLGQRVIIKVLGRVDGRPQADLPVHRLAHQGERLGEHGQIIPRLLG